MGFWCFGFGFCLVGWFCLIGWVGFGLVDWAGKGMSFLDELCPAGTGINCLIVL